MYIGEWLLSSRLIQKVFEISFTFNERFGLWRIALGEILSVGLLYIRWEIVASMWLGGFLIINT